MKKSTVVFVFLAIGAGAFFVYRNHILNEMIKRLRADSRVAEVLVTQQEKRGDQLRTTLKFLEYDSLGRPLSPRYFTLNGDLIQFQALVIRFDDKSVMAGVPFKGKSASIFTKIFVLGNSPEETQVFEINKCYDVPSGYRIGARQTFFERLLWIQFWEYALDENVAHAAGVKNAQIEAPGTRFVPGRLYTVKIEHDGGLRIDSEELPPVLAGERLEF
jgi:hypothetical protein